MSLPTRERGLKQITVQESGKVAKVAPHAGARIETDFIIAKRKIQHGRSPRGSAD